MAKTIDGRKAEITNVGRRFSTYEAFAKVHGYPEAAAESDSSDIRVRPENGDIVTLLTSGPHLTGYRGDTLWVVEAANGERHVIAEEGLRIIGITLLPDESLGGILREYREIKRQANAGEVVIMTEATGTKTVSGRRVPDYHNGDTFVIDHISGSLAASTNGKLFYHCEYSVLEPTEVLVIDGKRLRMVDRKAAVGERVIVTKTAPHYSSFSVGEYGVVTGEFGWVDEDVHVDFGDKTKFIGPSARHSEYAVLEPVESEAETASFTPLLSDLPAQDQAAANIAALTLKVTELEKRILALETDSAPSTVEIAPVSGKTPQQIRDEIVECAKADIEALKVTHHPTLDRYYRRGWNDMDAEFIVNSAKRSVVCLLRARYNGAVEYRGFAKCAPGEVFNSHIGRAIALHRALGLTVPAEYLNAPAPTEVRVGDVVKGGIVYAVRPTHRTVGVNPPQAFVAVDSGYTYIDAKGREAWEHLECAQIIDDSRETSGVTAAPSPRKEAA